MMRIRTSCSCGSDLDIEGNTPLAARNRFTEWLEVHKKCVELNNQPKGENELIDKTEASGGIEYDPNFDPRTAEVRRVEYDDGDGIKIRCGLVLAEDDRMLYIAAGADAEGGNWATMGHVDIEQKWILNATS